MDGGFGEEAEKAGLEWEMMKASETRRPSVKEMRKRSPDLAQDQSPEEERLRSHHSQLHHRGFGPLSYSYLCACLCVFDQKDFKN